MKKIIVLLLCLCMVLSICACSAKESETTTKEVPVSAPVQEKSLPSKDIQILYTNDVHCGIEDNMGYKGLVEIKNALQANGSTVLITDSGDFSQGGNIGTLTDGEEIIDIMNEIGYTIATLGNHEFDYGMDQLLSNVGRAQFPIVSCNFMDIDGNEILDPYQIIEANGVKIAFVGISTPQSQTAANPKNFKDENGEVKYQFCQDNSGDKLYSQVQSAVDSAKAEGAQYVIALAHLGDSLESSPWTSSEVLTHTSGIDALLDGHSHSVYECEKVKNAEGKEAILSQTGTKLQNIGLLTIKTDGSMTAKLINDSGIQSYINDMKAEFEDVLDQVVAHTNVNLTITDPATGLRMVRQNETNLGDLDADAFKAILGTDVALVNAGVIRDSISAGDITYGQILTVHPFNNNLCSCEATGQDIIDALEFGVANLPSEESKFMHVSGITYTIDMSVTSTVTTDSTGNFTGVEGERRVKDVMINGEPVDLDRIYTVASTQFLLKNGGDGMCMFKDNEFIIDEGPLDSQALSDYIVDVLKGTVGEEYSDVYGQGRITIING